MSDAPGLKKDNGRRTAAAEDAARNRIVKQTIGQNRRVRRNNLRIDRLQRRAEKRAEEQAADAVAKTRAALARQCAVITKPGDDPYRGEYDCSDCCSMSHCETHHKTEGTYPFDGAPVYGGVPDASLDRGASTDVVLAESVLKAMFPDRRID
jgi:hypothetical protein